mmetsp:Transcript_2300/g.5678  ORF Transcript_2300/g.5678 Transcript_2300/m.5678 type:complete len:214 (-) Transcript_2300:148-789(-)
MHAILQHADKGRIDALAHEGVVRVAREVRVAVPRDLVLDHNLGDAVLWTEVLILRANDVERRHIDLATDLASIRRRREVAVLDAEGVDEASADHVPVPLVVEACYRHPTLRSAAEEEASRLDVLRKPRDGEMQLAATELVAPLVETAVLVRVFEDLAGTCRVNACARRGGAVDEVPRPVVDVIVCCMQRQDIFVPQLSHGGVLRVSKPVRGND